MSNVSAQAPLPGAARSASPGFLRRFTVLLDAPRELWLLFAIKFIAVAAYGITISTLKLWLSSDFGYSDQQALGIVGIWSLLMTVATVMVGSLADAIGLRRTFFIGVWLCILARGVMAFTNMRVVALAAGLAPLAIGEALGTPVMVAAVRRYSNTRQRSISFSIFYAMMNVGFLIASLLFDSVRNAFGEHGHFHVPLVGSSISTYRTLFLVGLGMEVSLIPLVYFLRDGAEATDEGLVINPRKEKRKGLGVWRSIVQALSETARETGRLLAGLVKQDGFYRLIAFLMLIAFLKLIMMQMEYVFPTFGIRVLGEGAPVGKLWAINSALIIFLVPLVGALTQRFRAYGMVTVGGIISAVSVFIMALPPAWFSGMANSSTSHWLASKFLGLHGFIHPYYVMIVFFVILLSVGEAFYSPRVYEYAASIAPRGQETSYSSLSYVPFLLAKLLIATLSAKLLAVYCPAQGPRNSPMMWLVVAITASIAPIGLIAFRKYIRVREAGRE
ncbi:MAG TPA: MFS transporter [Verrucomicrobiae bacterium]|nr:MFS transporter [Verrucomicrobiae bacterium]